MEELQASLSLCEEKYLRLFRAHEKTQKLNQCLEEKLLNLAESHHEENVTFSSQIDCLTQSLVEARVYIHQLEDENDRYRNDINAVVQLLQCKPSSFVSPKIGMLPEDLQRKVLGQKNGAGSGRKEKKIIKVQVPCTLPQMDIMYAVDNGKVKRSGENDIVSAAIMATILQEREKERNENHRCHCGLRNIRLPTHSVQTQTLPSCTISYSSFVCPENSIQPNGLKDAEQNDKLKQNSEPKYSPSPNKSTTNGQVSSLSPSLSLGLGRAEPSRIHRLNSLKLSQLQPKKLNNHSTSVVNDNKDNGGHNEDAHFNILTTVLVQHPPKRLDSLLSKPGDIKSMSTTTTAICQEMDSDEPSQNQSPSTSKYQSQSQARQQQYYRAQKRSFWTRSSSTTSTETEI